MNQVTKDFIARVIIERARQDAQWGGADHDVNHSCIEWLGFIQHQCLRAAQEHGSDRCSVDETYERFIKIAALCLAAIEARDL